MSISFSALRGVTLGAAIALSVGFTAPAFAAGAADTTVVATIDGEKITRAELEALKQQMAAQYPQLGQVPLDAVYKGLLDRAIDQRLMEKEARKAKMQNDADVKAQLKDVESELIRRAWLSKTVEKRVTDDKVKAAYDQMIKSTPDEEEVRARHILVETEDKAKELIGKLTGGAKFEDIAKTESKDPGAANGGDLGFFRKGDMVPEFSEAAFGMKAGELSKAPVKTQFGWHIIKVEERRKMQPPKLEDVAAQLRGEVAQAEAAAVIKDLRDKAKVETFNPDGTKPAK
ncbi:peptidylprolyl isomerase [Novispirillum itersonii]|uniref:Parvulin-like PPIase n=1 Tax=Novispirillum itersonii TaxID=189 RepID=A0A7X0DMC0_NOVIT|nr:peptidylprolyl isomerase [Novispirillum itersonii]MBB6210825.1 peptidyl-prolyl cis-trans isomerase C [Novispirillum itersonii]